MSCSQVLPIFSRRHRTILSDSSLLQKMRSEVETERINAGQVGGNVFKRCFHNQYNNKGEKK